MAFSCFLCFYLSEGVMLTEKNVPQFAKPVNIRTVFPLFTFWKKPEKTCFFRRKNDRFCISG